MSESKSVWSRWIGRIVKGAIAACVVAGTVYWFRYSPIAVESHTVERATIVAEVLGTGTLEARVETTISPRIQGRIVEVLVDQGGRVSEGDLLVRLDDDELKQQVAIAQANLDAASAAIVRLTTDKDRATAVADQAQASYERTQSLLAQKAMSRAEADKATEGLAIAQAGVSRAEAAIAEGQKELVAAEKSLQYHQARLLDTEIRAPFDGLIIKRIRESGDVVVPGSSILTLISTDELWISAWVDETEMARLRDDQSARVVFRSEPDKSWPGQLVRLGRETDRETREFIVDIRVLELPTNWAVGQRAEAFIEVERRRDAITIPARFVISRDGEQGVYVNVDGTAAWHPVNNGVRGRDTVEVLEGIEVGDVVVTPPDGASALRNGRHVVERSTSERRDDP